jgi:hypothetical protein
MRCATTWGNNLSPLQEEEHATYLAHDVDQMIVTLQSGQHIREVNLAHLEMCECQYR